MHGDAEEKQQLSTILKELDLQGHLSKQKAEVLINRTIPGANYFGNERDKSIVLNHD